jgi:hypothetical protein
MRRGHGSHTGKQWVAAPVPFYLASFSALQRPKVLAGNIYTTCQLMKSISPQFIYDSPKTNPIDLKAAQALGNVEGMTCAAALVTIIRQRKSDQARPLRAPDLAQHGPAQDPLCNPAGNHKGHRYR